MAQETLEQHLLIRALRKLTDISFTVVRISRMRRRASLRQHRRRFAAL